MARRVVFTDPETGQFVSAETAMGLDLAIRTVFQDGDVAERQILSFGSVQEDTTPYNDPNWEQIGSKWGTAWDAGDAGLDMSALNSAQFPDGFDSFRIQYQIQQNPDYPSGYASSDWFTSDQWPPSLDALDRPGVIGIARVYFRLD